MDPFFGAAADLEDLADVHIGLYTFGNEEFADKLARDGLRRLREAENLGTIRLNTASGHRILTTASEAARRAAILAASRDKRRSTSSRPKQAPPKQVPARSKEEQRNADYVTERPDDLEDRNRIDEEYGSDDEDEEVIDDRDEL